MTKYRVVLVVDAPDIGSAIGKFLYDDSAEPVEGISSVEAEEWDL